MPSFASFRAKVARWVAGKRAYAQGAVVDRLSTDWRLSSASGNQETRADIRELRRRARALFRDDPYVNAAVREFVQNIVGEEGIRPHPRNLGHDGLPAQKANQSIKDAWADWGHKETATVDRISSWVDAQDRIVESWVIDGEVFIRKHQGFRNKYGFAIELIDPDLLDEQMNVETLPNGNQIWMGVEIDKWGAPVAYHFWSHHPSESGRRERIAVPAGEILHLFKRKRAKQTRGITLLSPIIFRLKMLGAYEDAEVTAARISAAKMGFFEPMAEALDSFEAPKSGEKVLMDVSAGSMEQLPPGLKFVPWDPQHPNANMGGFVKNIVRSIAIGIGMAYTTLSGDLEGTNYSSIRAGLLSERDFWKRLQKWVAEHVHRPIFASWLEIAILTPQLSLPSRLAERWLDIEWRGRGWKWVDPYNDARANEMMIALGLTSRQRLCSDMGVEFEDMIDDLKRENEIAAAAGVDIAGISAKDDSPHPVDENGNQQPADKKDDTNKKAIEFLDERQRDNTRMLHAIASTSRSPINVATPDVKVDVRAPDVRAEIHLPAPATRNVAREILNIEDGNGKVIGYRLHETRELTAAESPPTETTPTEKVA